MEKKCVIYQGPNLIEKQLIDEIWKNKILVLYHITDKDDMNIIQTKGITITQKYPGILTKKEINKLVTIINNKQVMLVIAIPDILHKYVYDINDADFEEYKKDYNYETNEDYMLDEISGSYAIMDYCDCDLIVKNYLPPALIYGEILLDEDSELKFYRNQQYFDNLLEEEQKKLCDIIKSCVLSEIKYDEYLSLISSFNYNSQKVKKLILNTHKDD